MTEHARPTADVPRRDAQADPHTSRPGARVRRPTPFIPGHPDQERFRQAREGLAEEAREQLQFVEDVDPDADIERRGVGLHIGSHVLDAEREGAIEHAATQMDAQVDWFDVQPGHLTVTDDGDVAMTEEAQQELEQAAEEEQRRRERRARRRARRQRRRAEREAQEEVAEELSEEYGTEVDPDDVDVDIDSGEVHVASEDVQQELAAIDFDRQTRADIRVDDLVKTDDGFQLSEWAQRRIGAAEIEHELTSPETLPGAPGLGAGGAGTVGGLQAVDVPGTAYDVDVSPVDVTIQADGSYVPSDQIQQQIAAQDFDRQIAVRDIDTSDVVRVDDGFQIDPDIRREIHAQQIGQEVGRDVAVQDIERTTDGYRLRHETAQRFMQDDERARHDVAAELGIDPQHIESRWADDEYDYRITREGARQYYAQQLGEDPEDVQVTFEDGEWRHVNPTHVDSSHVATPETAIDAVSPGPWGSGGHPPDPPQYQSDLREDTHDELGPQHLETQPVAGAGETVEGSVSPEQPGGPGAGPAIDAEPQVDVTGAVDPVVADVRDAAGSVYEDTVVAARDPDVIAPSAELFGTEDRDRAIHRAIDAGSIGGRFAGGGMVIEHTGRAATERLDRAIPDTDRGPRIGEPMEVDGEVHEAPPAGQQLRNIAVATPEFMGIAGGLGGRAAGDVIMQAEHAAGRDIDEDVFQDQDDVREGLTHGGDTMWQAARHEPVGAVAGLALPGYQFGTRTVGGASRGYVDATGSTRLDTGRVPRPTIDPINIGETQGLTLGIGTRHGKVAETQPLLTATRPSIDPWQSPLQLGTPDVRIGSRIGEGGVSPAMNPTEARAVTRRLGDEGAKIEGFRDVQRDTQFSRLRPDELESHIGDVLDNHGISREIAGTVTQELASVDAQVYGSLTQRASGGDVVPDALGRPARDIDAVVPDKSSFADRITRRINEEAGRDVVEVRDGTPVVRETGEKLFDLHEPPTDAQSYMAGRDQRFGVDPEPLIMTEDGLRTTTLTEQTARKGEGAMKLITEDAREISPGVEAQVGPLHSGRVKDVADFYVGERANIRNLEQRGMPDRAARARENLDTWLEQWPEEFQSRAREQWRQAQHEPQLLADFGGTTTARSSVSPRSAISSQPSSMAVGSSLVASQPGSSLTEAMSDPSSVAAADSRPSTASTADTSIPGFLSIGSSTYIGDDSSIFVPPDSSPSPRPSGGPSSVPSVTVPGRTPPAAPTPGPRPSPEPEDDPSAEPGVMDTTFTGEPDDELAPGWLGETLAAFAGVDRAAVAARTGQEHLEEQRDFGFEGEIQFDWGEEAEDVAEIQDLMFR